MEITSLILSTDFQIYVTQGQGAQLYYVDVYKLQWMRSGEQPGIFYGSGSFVKKGTIYARYYSYILSVIHNTLISVTKTNHYMTFMIEVLICLFRYMFI